MRARAVCGGAGSVDGAGGRSGGFSLIELLIVMVIIAILAGIGIPMYLAQRDRAKNARAVDGGRTIMIAVLSYAAARDEADSWPVSAEKGLLVGSGAIAASDWPKDAFSGLVEDMRPVDPGQTTPGRYLYREAPGHMTTGRHQIVVYLKDADPYVIP